MRFLVWGGTECEADELFNTAETVLGVSPTRSATERSVTGEFESRPAFFFADFIRLGTSTAQLTTCAPRHRILDTDSIPASPNLQEPCRSMEYRYFTKHNPPNILRTANSKPSKYRYSVSTNRSILRMGLSMAHSCRPVLTI